jgi:hypothetical protein
MHRIAAELLRALEARDASCFGSLCRELEAAPAERQRCGEDLIAIVAGPDAAKAELAVDALRFSGVATDDRVHRRLFATACAVFPDGELAAGANAERSRMCEGRERMPAKVRLLQSISLAMLRKAEADGLAFVSRVERHFAGTPLAAHIAACRGGPDSGPGSARGK